MDPLKKIFFSLKFLFAAVLLIGLIMWGVIFLMKKSPAVSVYNGGNSAIIHINDSASSSASAQPAAIGSSVDLPVSEPVETASSTVFSTLEAAGASAPNLSVLPADDSANYSLGMAVGEALMGLSNRELAQQLDDIASLGITWLRIDIDWSNVQPKNSDEFSWGDIDRFVKASNKRGIKLLAIIVNTPEWARSPDCAAEGERCAPADPDVFAAFAAQAVARYAPKGIKTWEIWNEENLAGSWGTKADIDGYFEVLKASSQAIKKVDPSATVILGGMSPSDTENGCIAPVEFLEGLYQRDAKNYFDAVGYHPYCYPEAPNDYKPWSGWSQMAQTSPSVRSVMEDYGDASKKMWLTEFGAPTGGPLGIRNSQKETAVDGIDHVSENLQSVIISQAVDDAKKYSWAGPLFIYSYWDLSAATDNNENFFGVVRYDGTRKPAYEAIKSKLAD